MTGGQIVAQALLEKQIEYIFTLSGGHITPIYQLPNTHEITLLDTRATGDRPAVCHGLRPGKLTSQARCGRSYV